METCMLFCSGLMSMCHITGLFNLHLIARTPQAMSSAAFLLGYWELERLPSAVGQIVLSMHWQMRNFFIMHLMPFITIECKEYLIPILQDSVVYIVSENDLNFISYIIFSTQLWPNSTSEHVFSI